MTAPARDRPAAGPAPVRAATVILPIGSDADLAWVRQQVRRTAAGLGFGLVLQTKLVTAASELARNTLLHGGGGQLDIGTLGGERARGVRLVFTDNGPGIPDVERAMRDGYSTGGGLGLGLSGARRLVHEFAIETEPGRGTAVTVVVWDPAAPC
ncbi:anti-sigma regulatory factor [Streptomyces sp. JW3]|uniref:anti-sigma regulatory factor n=1 Tax=Streptomyces sp. JW3 TaxID=3456955 RepID=UPI003FA4987D